MKGDIAPTRRAAIYTRKSTTAGLEQDFNSLDAQREACAAYAKSQGWDVVGTYDDGGFTGANVERPAFQRLLADIDAHLIDVVVVYKVDRLSRSLLDFSRLMDRFGQAGASFVSVTQNFSTADAMGRLTLNMLMSFAEFEREMIGERTRDKIAGARRRGKWTGGPVPLGYSAVDKKLVKITSEALVIEEVFELYETHRSALVVMKELRARGRRMKKNVWTKDGVLRVLRNPLYAGLIACANELHASEHEAIISRERFDRVQAMLSRPQIASGGKNPAYLLRGLLRCGACGAALTPAGSREYRYYRCVTRDKGGASACTTKPLSAGAIEKAVVERLRGIATDPGHVGELTTRLGARIATERRSLLAIRGELPKKLAKLATDARALLETVAALSGRARTAAEQRLESTMVAQHEVETELGAVERKIAALDAVAVDAEWVARSLGDFEGLWDLMTPGNRQHLVAALVVSVVVNEAAEEIDIQLADLLAEERTCA